MAASGHPDRIALGNRETGSTFRQLARDSAAGASVLVKQQPSHVAFLGRNGSAYPQLLFASAIAGIPFVPLNYRQGPEQIHALLAGLQNPLVVVDEVYRHLLGTPPGKVLTTEDFMRATGETRPEDSDQYPKNDVAVLLFTSGTTAQPKAVVLRHSNLVSYILATVEFGSAAENEAALVAVPPYHVAAIGSVLSNLHGGRRVVYLPDFDPTNWLELVDAEHITSAMVVPTMLARLVDRLEERPAKVPSLRQIAYGGARTPRPVVERAMDAFPNVAFVNAYGLTETSSTIALLGPEDHREATESPDPRVRARLGSVGRPVPGLEIEIRDDAGQAVGVHEVGSLWVRGAQVSGECLGEASVLDAEGWFPTRDRCYLDADGYLYIEGRADDTIIRGGENIAPAEIEDVLLAHSAVQDAAVIGIPDDEWGERICAVVVPRAGAHLSSVEVRDFVRSRLRGSRTPDEVVLRDSLPYNATGKLVRRELRHELAQGR
jgi:acyl-CoA synthetase (AMP-forming)/AMP-acid ligase II